MFTLDRQRYQGYRLKPYKAILIRSVFQILTILTIEIPMYCGHGITTQVGNPDTDLSVFVYR